VGWSDVRSYEKEYNEEPLIFEFLIIRVPQQLILFLKKQAGFCT
jgi:hypothetical protein